MLMWLIICAAQWIQVGQCSGFRCGSFRCHARLISAARADMTNSTLYFMIQGKITELNEKSKKLASAKKKAR